MSTYRQVVSPPTRKVRALPQSTPQSKPIPQKASRMTQMASGGYGFKISDMAHLRRCLITGTNNATYYASGRQLTSDFANTISSLITSGNGLRAVQTITEVSESRLAPSNDHALYALANVIKMGDVAVRKAAWEAMPKVARTGGDFLRLQDNLDLVKVGWGRLRREWSSKWYTEKDLGDAVFQVMKYGKRAGYSHRDVLRLSHPKPSDSDEQGFFKWVTHDDYSELATMQQNRIAAQDEAQHTDNLERLLYLIETYRLSHEMIGTQWLKTPAVWQQLLESNLPMQAMIRSLGRMTGMGMLNNGSNALTAVLERLCSEQYILKSGVHPFKFLVALRQYQQGRSGDYGHEQTTWYPNSQISSALEDAFYMAFGNVKPSGRNMLIALDVSPSMSGAHIDNLGRMTACEAGAALAMTLVRTEPWHEVIGFATKPIKLGFTPETRLADAQRIAQQRSWGGTDAAQPILLAIQNNWPVDTIAMITDNESWQGVTHVDQALHQLREKSGKDTRLITVSMTPNRATLADTHDPYCLDIAGFSADTPQLITAF